MATPAKIAIGWRNRILDAGVTYSCTDENASHTDDNLGKPHPNPFLRIDASESSVSLTHPRS